MTKREKKTKEEKIHKRFCFFFAYFRI